MTPFIDRLLATDIEIQILFLSIVILFFITSALLIYSLSVRSAHRHYDAKIEALKNKYFPLALEYLDVEKPVTKKDILNKLGKSGIDYHVFELVVIELLDQLTGDDAVRLRELLYLDPIFEWHLKQLYSKSDTEKVKACIYFGYVRLINYRVIVVLKKLLYDKNKLLSYSAASALMASKNVMIRLEALESQAGSEYISEMALLELLYKFKYENENQRDLEAFYLIKIIENEKILDKNRALIIGAVSEMNYHQLQGFLSQAILSEDQKWKTKEILISLIKAQGNLMIDSTISRLRELMKMEDADIKLACIEVLSRYFDEEINVEIMKELNYEDFVLDYNIIKALATNNPMYREVPALSQYIDETYATQLLEMIRPEIILLEN